MVQFFAVLFIVLICSPFILAFFAIASAVAYIVAMFCWAILSGVVYTTREVFGKFV